MFKKIQDTQGQIRHINKTQITQFFEMAGSVRVSLSDGSFAHIAGTLEQVMEELK